LGSRKIIIIIILNAAFGEIVSGRSNGPLFGDIDPNGFPQKVSTY